MQLEQDLLLGLKIKSNPITGLDRPWEFQEVEVPRFQDSQHMKVARLLALRTGRHYPPRKCSWCPFLLEAESPQYHSATRRIMLMKNSSDTIGNWTRDLLACSAVPQPTALPHTPSTENGGQKLHLEYSSTELFDLDTKTEKTCCGILIANEKGISENFGKTVKLMWGGRG